MGTAERRERERLALRQSILDAARELFLREGFEAVTMRKIAERIDYSATALYKHFEDKNALLTALLDTDFQALLEVLQRQETLADPTERLLRQFSAYVEFALGHPDHYRLLFLSPRAVSGETCNSTAESTYAYFRGTIEAGVAQGVFRRDLADVDALAQTMWGALHGALALEFLRPQACGVSWAPLEKRLTFMREALIQGLFAEPLARERTPFGPILGVAERL